MMFLLLVAVAACSGSGSDKNADPNLDGAVADAPPIGELSALFEACNDPSALPDLERVARVCRALEPAGTRLSATAAGALNDGSLDTYTTSDSDTFCPAVDRAIALAVTDDRWDVQRADLLAERDTASTALDTMVAAAPMRFGGFAEAYAAAIKPQLERLGPDSPATSWDTASVENALTEIQIARALSCD